MTDDIKPLNPKNDPMKVRLAELIANTIEQPSYHDEIQVMAREVEASRGKIYNDKNPAAKIVWTRAQIAFLQASQYKLFRIEAMTKDINKVYDDLLDVYNFVALLFRDLKKGERGELQS